jgi:glycosyltransferase involved in cell wall biosynthesis
MHVQSPVADDARVLREAQALIEHGYRVTIVDIEHQRRQARKERVDAIEVRHVFMSRRSAKYYDPIKSLPWLAFKVTRLLKSLVQVPRTRADAYHAHDISALPACLLAACLRRKPLIFDAHELPMTQDHLVRRHLVQAVSTTMLKFMLQRCSAAITVSPPLATEMQRLFGGPLAVVVRNIPDYQAPGRTDRLRGHFGLPSTTQIALYQGRFQANRSLGALVHSAPFLNPGIVIVLMGSGSDRGEIEALISRLGVEQRVKIKDHVPYEELLSWTSSADIGLSVFDPDISLSTRYCLPNKVFEYLMAGLPVLTTPLDAVVEIVQQYGAGVEIPRLEPRLVATALNYILAKPDELARMRNAALAAAARDLRWSVERERVWSLYDSLLRRSQYGDSPPLASFDGREDVERSAPINS